MPIGAALALSANGLFSLPAFAQPDTAQTFQPTSAWNVDYAEDSCALQRSFANGSDEISLDIRAYQWGNFFEVTVAGLTVSPTAEKIRFRIEPGGTFSEARNGRLLTSDKWQAVRFSGRLEPSVRQDGATSDLAEPEQTSREESMSGLRIDGTGSGEVLLQTGPLSQPMDALRVCVDDLLTGLGLDPAPQRSLSRSLKPRDQMTLARKTQEGLPREVLKEAWRGRADIRIIVGPLGRPSSCGALGSSRETAFGKYACEMVMRYARYEPALDASGEPVASVYVTTITYSGD